MIRSQMKRSARPELLDDGPACHGLSKGGSHRCSPRELAVVRSSWWHEPTISWSLSPGRVRLCRMDVLRTDPPLATDEATTLVAFLDYHRDTLRMKTEGLTQAQLAQSLAPSSLTLGGLLKHLALVEASWFGEVLHGRPMGEPWDSVDWDADPNWEFRTAADDSPEQLRAMLDAAVEQSRRNIDEALAAGGLDQLSVALDRKENQQFSLRWILLHLIEEYARHNGHADFLREAIDGVTGE